MDRKRGEGPTGRGGPGGGGGPAAGQTTTPLHGTSRAAGAETIP